jgi:hypothetical protein
MSNFSLTNCQLKQIVTESQLYLLLSFLSCYVESSVEIFGDRMHLSPTALQAEHNNVNIA